MLFSLSVSASVRLSVRTLMVAFLDRFSPKVAHSPAVKPPILGDACIRVRIKYFLQFHDLWTILSKIREGVALSPLSILHKPVDMQISCRDHASTRMFSWSRIKMN